MTVATGLADVGVAVARSATCRTGLSLAYMAGAAVVTPAPWLDPLGALVKTGPTILLVPVALATLDER